jgi:hypothetical protein
MMLRVAGSEEMEELPKNEQDCLTRSREIFVQWADDHDAYVKDIRPSGIVVAAGVDERRYEPDGGLNVKDWPDLKAICGAEDDDVTHLNRDDLIAAILENMLLAVGHPVVAVNLAVADMAEVHKPKYLWVVFENSSENDVEAALNARAKEITDEIAQAQRRRETEAREERLRVVPDGMRAPDTFWWKG